MYAANTNSIGIAHIYECYGMIVATQFVAPLVCVGLCSAEADRLKETELSGSGANSISMKATCRLG